MTKRCPSSRIPIALILPLMAAMLAHPPALPAQSSLASVVAEVQPKIAKIYGAGGTRGLEHYQTGLVVSATGHILTVWSYVLDSTEVIVVLHDGRRFPAQLVGNDPRLEIALLKVEAGDLPHFELDGASAASPAGSTAPLSAGAKVLAFSNLFNVATGDEAASVQHGVVAAYTSLSARRGVYATAYQGAVYVLDAVTNNPGAAGGALTDRHGKLAGMLGKELRSTLDNTWLNYALPAAELAPAVVDLMNGVTRPRANLETARRPAEPMTLELLGLVLVPNVLPKTPPFLDSVRPGSPAAKAGLRPDDLVVFLNDVTITSAQSLLDELGLIDRIDEVRLTVLRGQQLIEVSVFATR